MMKSITFLLMAAVAMLMFVSCKKDNASSNITITTTLPEGTANASGEFILTGHISSAARLEKVWLTKEGQTTVFLADETTAKNKNEYDYSYLITGITVNTFMLIDVYDQNGTKITKRFLIKKL